MRNEQWEASCPALGSVRWYNFFEKQFDIELMQRFQSSTSINSKKYNLLTKEKASGRVDSHK